MLHTWTEPQFNHIPPGEPRTFRCLQCGEVQRLHGRWYVHEYGGDLVLRYPLPRDGCTGTIH